METTEKINSLEVQKELMKLKVMADFSHYESGKLFYTVCLIDSTKMGTYQFPISTIEEGPTINDDESGLSMYEIETVILSKDLGTTSFGNKIKASELFRWIKKAIEKDEFIKIS